MWPATTTIETTTIARLPTCVAAVGRREAGWP
jgi:hypothetical protein